MERILITGANRGIRFGIVKEYLKKEDVKIFACCRFPEKADDLKELLSKNKEKLIIVQLDQSDQKSIEGALAAVKEHVDGLDVLINNAAMRYHRESERFGKVDMDEFTNSMKVNAVGPFMIVQTFIDLLKAGKNTRIVNVTTGPLVPVEYNLPYNYCISKAALNLITRYFAVNFAEFGITSVGLYPGWVKTRLGGENARITIEESGKGIVDVVSSLTIEDNEKFVAYDGSTLSRIYW